MAEDAATAAYEVDIARDLSNPVAALISVPIQFNYDRGVGPPRMAGGTCSTSSRSCRSRSRRSGTSSRARSSRSSTRRTWCQAAGASPGSATSCRACSFRRRSPRQAASSTAWVPPFCCRPPPTAASAPSSGRWDRRASRLGRTVPGPSGCSPITSGRWRATATGRASTRPSSNRSSPTSPGRAPRSRSTPSRPMIGSATSGSCRSTSQWRNC